MKNKHLSLFTFHFSPRGASRGFTLIEMLVVVGIIAVVSAVLMFNYSDFSSNVSVRNLSQEVALAIRKAQTYATSVRSVDGTLITQSDRYDGYGISFVSGTQPQTDATQPSNKTFVLFADIPIGRGESDGMYGGRGTCGAPSDSQNECVETFGISTADRIVGICGDRGAVYNSQSYTDCGLDQTHRADISFNRPSPDAHIIVDGYPSSYAKIVLISPKGLYRAVTVWNTGQISVQ